jgi:hypothetical protein
MKSLLVLIIACATTIDVPLYGQSKNAAEHPRKPKITFIEL